MPVERKTAEDYISLIECDDELYEIFIGKDPMFDLGEQLVLRITKQTEESAGLGKGLLPYRTVTIRHLIDEAEKVWAEIRTMQEEPHGNDV